MRILMLKNLSYAGSVLARAAQAPGLPGLTIRAMSDTNMSGMGAGIMKGGTAGGTIRESGGIFGEREAALENMYFTKLTNQQLEDLRNHHMDEIMCLEKELKQTEESVKRHKMRLDALKKLANQLE
jgi:hypothetical protein